jgi:sugar lactone lactonase YvrE
MQQQILVHKTTTALPGNGKPRTFAVPGILLSLILWLLSVSAAIAHPGSGIVIDKQGNIYFTDTGKGVWKIDKDHRLTYIPASRFHWMTLDTAGYFAGSPKSFGGYFERVTLQSDNPALIMCSDFPVALGKDGNIYYADTRAGSAKIMRRTPGGKETVLAANNIFQFTGGIAAGPDGSIYITEASNAAANTARKITMNGAMSIIATYAGKSSNDFPVGTVPSYCRGLVVDSAGTVYVAATGSRSILKITPQGKMTTILQATRPLDTDRRYGASRGNICAGMARCSC